MHFRDLLSPTRIGGLELKNRVAMAPMGVEIVEADGVVREPTIEYYAERARGGVGLIISENTAAAYPRGANSAQEIAVSSDDYLPGLARLAERVHAHGTKIAIQLAHHGKVGRLDTQQGRELLMPSLPRKDNAAPPGPLDLSAEEISLMAKAAGGGRPRIRVATREDLEGLVEDFADAAGRARRAGFDAVEIHGAHGYIFSEFLSPAWNSREDEYGGTLENRARLLCEVVRACKARAGDDFPVWCRIDALEFGTPGGIRLSDSTRTAQLLEAAGADAIHVSAYANPLGAGFTQAPIVHREGGFVEFASAVKAEVNVPLIAAGRIPLELGQRLVRDGRADVIAMGRALLADPELVAKLAQSRREDIRPCVYCYVCVAQPFFDRKVRCAVNPVTAEELRYAERSREKASQPQKVVVVGGGPAGLEAASVAAQRGHQVVLFERSRELGGTLRFAALAYEPNQHLLDWLEARIRKLPVELRLGEEASAEAVRELSPDVVIAAVGAVREKSVIPGSDRDHVWDGDDLRRLLFGGDAGPAGPRLPWIARMATGAGRLLGIARDPSRLRRASRLYMPIGRKDAIVGGGLVGAELAEFFAARGRSVAVLEEGPIVAAEMAHPRRWRVLADLREAGVRLETNARVSEIREAVVRFDAASESGAEPRAREVPADTVVIARGLVANPSPVEALKWAGAPVIPIGDANGVGYIEGAIHAGFRAAIEL
ncbi:MAG: FAD-dependent oxidoreductase [Proteobacteria bacterium]|nr:FAD-dependent oxidoreductase [Pseudomonadota bacterium]